MLQQLAQVDEILINAVLVTALPHVIVYIK